MGLSNIFTRARTPEDKLFKAVNKLDLNKVRELLATGADSNARNNLNRTPLDICVEKLEDVTAVTAYYASDLNRLNDKASRISRIWNELVRANGTLNIYKDDEIANGTVLNGTGANNLSSLTLNKPALNIYCKKQLFYSIGPKP